MGALILLQPLKKKDQVFAIVTRSKLVMVLTRLQYSDYVLKRETTHCLKLHEIKLSLRKKKKKQFLDVENLSCGSLTQLAFEKVIKLIPSINER